MSALSQCVLHREAELDPLFSNILVPVGFSERSTSAARFAIHLAGSFHARVTLFHVERPPEGDLFRMAEVARQVEERMATFLPDFARDRNVARIVRVDPDVASAILRHADENRIDLIVMPTQGYGPIRRMLRGSVTAKVLQSAASPVWTTARTFAGVPAEPQNPERILCAAGTASEGERVLTWASRLAAQRSAQVCVAWSRKGLVEEPEKIDRVQRRFRIDAETVFEPKDVSEALRDAAVRLRAGLLVISRNSRPGLGFSGMNMYGIVRDAVCPVISL